MGILLPSLRMCIKGKSFVYRSELRSIMAARCLIEDRIETTAPWVMNAIMCLVTLQSHMHILQWASLNILW